MGTASLSFHLQARQVSDGGGVVAGRDVLLVSLALAAYVRRLLPLLLLVVLLLVPGCISTGRGQVLAYSLGHSAIYSLSLHITVGTQAIPEAAALASHHHCLTAWAVPEPSPLPHCMGRT